MGWTSVSPHLDKCSGVLTSLSASTPAPLFSAIHTATRLCLLKHVSQIFSFGVKSKDFTMVCQSLQGLAAPSSSRALSPSTPCSLCFLASLPFFFFFILIGQKFPLWNVLSSSIHTCLPAKSLLLCPALCNPMGNNQPGSSVHGNSLSKNTGMGFHVLL